MKRNCLSPEMLEKYRLHLKQEERAASTIQKYIHDVKYFFDFCAQYEMTKETVLLFKENLLENYSAASVNSMLAAVNNFLNYAGRHECCVKLLKIQHRLYRDSRREITREEYIRLVQTAERRKKRRLSLILQTICSTGIRVSELKFITYEALQSGRAEICNKGKNRIVFLPQKLCKLLKSYCEKNSRKEGSVFITRNGTPLGRCTIWKMMKSLCEEAHVQREKVFPHNLRHLFAQCFYEVQKDIEHLASILGHSNINTTRIYTMTSGNEHRQQIEALRLIL